MPSDAPTQVVRARRYIEGLLVSGHLGAQGRLPSSRSIAVGLGMSRTTVNAAIDELVAQGYLTTRPRSGVFAGDVLASMHRPDVDGPPTDWQRRLVRRAPPPVTTSGDWRSVPYPLITGQIAPELLVRAGWTRALRAAQHDAHHVWSYAEHSGDDPLLVEQILSSVAPSRGIEADPDQILVTLGSQHALSLVVECLVQQGTPVAVEDPGYPDARALLAHHGAELRPIDVDDDGLRVADVPDDARLCFVTPSHQHPSNVTLGLQRRIDLLARAGRQGMTIIEDDYDSELRYRGAASPALYSLDQGRNTIYLGTFSKFHSPGLRVGFVIAHADVIAELRSLLRLGVRQVPGVLQRALALYIGSGDHARSLANYRRTLADRWRRTAEQFHDELGHDQTFPAGGTSLWVRGAPGVDWGEVRRDALAEGILLTAPESHWALPSAPYRHLRVGITATSDAALREGVTRLGRLHREAASRAEWST